MNCPQPDAPHAVEFDPIAGSAAAAHAINEDDKCSSGQGGNGDAEPAAVPIELTVEDDAEEGGGAEASAVPVTGTLAAATFDDGNASNHKERMLDEGLRDGGEEAHLCETGKRVINVGLTENDTDASSPPKTHGGHHSNDFMQEPSERAKAGGPDKEDISEKKKAAPEVSGYQGCPAPRIKAGTGALAKALPEVIGPTAPSTSSTKNSKEKQHTKNRALPEVPVFPDIPPPLDEGRAHTAKRAVGKTRALPEVSVFPESPPLPPLDASSAHTTKRDVFKTRTVAEVSTVPEPPQPLDEGRPSRGFDARHQQARPGNANHISPLSRTTEAIPGETPSAAVAETEEPESQSGPVQSGGLVSPEAVPRDGRVEHSALPAEHNISHGGQLLLAALPATVVPESDSRNSHDRVAEHVRWMANNAPLIDCVTVAPQEDSTQSTPWWKEFLLRLCHHWPIVATAVLVVMAAITTAAVVIRRKKHDTMLEGPDELLSTSPAPTSDRFVAIKATLYAQTGSMALAMEDASSPQHRALLWLADEDLRQVDLGNIEHLRQRFALATIFFATGGDGSWSNTSNFLSEKHECFWNMGVPINQTTRKYGVFCDSNSSTVNYIRLRENNLTGSIPEEIGLLSGVEYVSLGENKITSPVPFSLGSLEKLKSLYLHKNKLTGTIPHFISKLSTLKHLWLGYNNFTGTIPLYLDDMSSLEFLGLQYTALTGTIPFTTGSLPYLQDLWLDYSILTGTIPEAVFSYLNLEYLKLEGNALTGTLSPDVGNLSNIEVLGVQHNLLDGTMPRPITNLTRLWYLTLTNNRFVGTVPLAIGQLGELTDLGLAFNKFTGTIPSTIGNLTKLEILDLMVNQFSGTVPPSFSNLKTLTYLGLNNNSFTGDITFLCSGRDRDQPIYVAADCFGDIPEVFCAGCCVACCSDELGLEGPVYGCYPQ